MANLPIIQTKVSPKVQKFADRISIAWQKAVDGILAVAQLLKDAENELNDVEQMDLHGELPFSKSTADKLLSIGYDQRLNNPTYREYLPPHWTTLYEMTQLDDKTFKDGIADGIINSAMEGRHILELRGQVLVDPVAAVQKTQEVIQQSLLLHSMIIK